MSGLLRRFLQWAKTFLQKGKPAPIPLAEPISSWYGTLYVAHRTYERAAYTWKFVPSYGTAPPDSILFLWCDDIQNYPQRGWKNIKRKSGTTHRLSLMLLNPGKHEEIWSGDFEMVGLAGRGNTAWFVTHLLAHLLLRNYYDQIDWQQKAERFVDRHKPSNSFQ